MSSPSAAYCFNASPLATNQPEKALFRWKMWLKKSVFT